MKEYHVNKNGQQIGPFSRDELVAGLKSGRFGPSDLVWKIGTADWVALSTVVSPPPPANAPFLPQQFPSQQLLTAPPAPKKMGCLKIIGTGFAVLVGLGIIGSMGGGKRGSSSNSSGTNSISELVSAPASGLRASGELERLFALGGDHTDLQREEKTQEIKGKVVQWTLTVYEVDKKGDDEFRIQTAGDEEVSTFINLITRSQSEKDYVRALKTGSVITVKGKIDDVTMRSIELDPAIRDFAEFNGSICLDSAFCVPRP